MNMHWSSIGDFLRRGEACALLTVVATRGSVPREVGTRMVVTARTCVGTIGGGQLEYQAVERARVLLQAPADEGNRSLHSYTLGPELRQCCGGVVDLTIERLNQNDLGWITRVERMQAREPCVLIGRAPEAGEAVDGRRHVVGASVHGESGEEPVAVELIDAARTMLDARHGNQLEPPAIRHIALNGQTWLLEKLTGPEFFLYLFGAGHVGRALVEVLAGYPCRIIWIDSRGAEFPDRIPGNVEKRVSANPVDEVFDTPADAFYLVMTHSHPLDLALCKAILGQPFAYLGLIGSKSKRARFQKQLRVAGADLKQLARLTCPIGIESIRGKHPAAIAVAVAAELIALSERQPAHSPVAIEPTEHVGA